LERPRLRVGSRIEERVMQREGRLCCGWCDRRDHGQTREQKKRAVPLLA